MNKRSPRDVYPKPLVLSLHPETKATSNQHGDKSPDKQSEEGLLRLFLLIQYLKAECVTFGAVREDQGQDIPLIL